MERDLAWQLLSRELGLTGTQRLFAPEYGRFLLNPLQKSSGYHQTSAQVGVSYSW